MTINSTRPERPLPASWKSLSRNDTRVEVKNIGTRELNQASTLCLDIRDTVVLEAMRSIVEGSILFGSRLKCVGFAQGEDGRWTAESKDQIKFQVV